MNAPLFPPGEVAAARWAAALPAGAFGRAGLRFFPATGSTQDQALAAAERGAPHGAAFLAEEQSAGRGRNRARWLSPPGRSLLVSVLLRPAPAAGESARAALSAAVAAARAIGAAAGADPEIKWPNDLLLGGRKTGGILIESRRGWAACGLGLNVSQRPEDFPPELRGTATSLAAETGAPPDRLALLGALLAELGRAFGTPEAPAEPWSARLVEIRRRLAWAGRQVRVRGCPGGPLAGRLAGLGEAGELLLEPAAGGRVAVQTGSLELEPAGAGEGPRT